jgi:hypothetical protein
VFVERNHDARQMKWILIFEGFAEVRRSKFVV